jgi:hypothetical protein
MTDEPRSVSLEIPGVGTATVRRLDDRTVYLAATNPVEFRSLAQPIAMTNGSLNIDLPPFGLATVDTKGRAA